MSNFEDLFENQKDMEARILGAIIFFEGEGFRDFELLADDFVTPSFQTIFEFMSDLFDRQGCFSFAVLLQKYDKNKYPVIYEDLLYAWELGALYPKGLSSWLPYLYEVSYGRKVRELVLQAETETDVEVLKQKIQGLSERIDRNRLVWPDLKLQLEEVLEGILKPVAKIPSCYPKLNDLMVGFRPGGFYVVGARPGVGKTLVGVQLAWELSKSVSTAFFSLEMTKQDLLQRVIAQELDIRLDDIERGEIKDFEKAKIEDLILNVDRQLFMTDPVSLTLENVRRFVLKGRQTHDLRVVFVDYLQLMTDKSNESMREKVSKISIGLKALAKEFGVSVVALAQVNRAAGDDGRPLASDLKESGQIEQDADLIVMLSRHASELDKKNDRERVSFTNLTEDVGGTKSLMLLDVVKNRHGAKGNFLMTVLGHYSRLGVY